jgi:hypothetical protein
MKKLIYAVAILALAACARKETSNAPASSAPATTAQATATSPAEDRYPMTATIVSRDPPKNMLNLDNKEVPGKMMAMKMAYEVRDAKVGSLPPDGAAVVVTMHDQNGKYWISDVKPQPKQ